MALDDEFLKQIIETFRAELEEQSQAITDGLLKIEKTPAQSKEFTDEIVKVSIDFKEIDLPATLF